MDPHLAKAALSPPRRIGFACHGVVPWTKPGLAPTLPTKLALFRNWHSFLSLNDLRSGSPFLSGVLTGPPATRATHPVPGPPGELGLFCDPRAERRGRPEPVEGRRRFRPNWLCFVIDAIPVYYSAYAQCALPFPASGALLSPRWGFVIGEPNPRASSRCTHIGTAPRAGKPRPVGAFRHPSDSAHKPAHPPAVEPARGRGLPRRPVFYYGRIILEIRHTVNKKM